MASNIVCRMQEDGSESWHGKDGTPDNRPVIHPIIHKERSSLPVLSILQYHLSLSSSSSPTKLAPDIVHYSDTKITQVQKHTGGVRLTWLVVHVEPDGDDLLLVARPLLGVADHLKEGVTRDLGSRQQAAVAGRWLVRAAGPAWNKGLS